MLVHRAHAARADRGGALQFGSTIDEVARSPARARLRWPRDNVAPAPATQLVDRRAAIRNDQRNAARPRLGRDHAKGLRLATVNEGVGAGEQARELAAVGEVRHHRNSCDTVREQFQLASRRAVADKEQADRRRRAAAPDGANHHVPPFLGREAANADEQDPFGVEPERIQRGGAQFRRSP